jgi:hypothetical protein
MFDSNQMHELAALSRDRYQRNGGGGVSKVYNTSKAFHDARGIKEMSPFRRAAYEAAVTFRTIAQNACSDFRAAGNDYDLALCARKDAARVALANIPF